LRRDWEGGVAGLAESQTIRELAHLIRPSAPEKPARSRPRRPLPRSRK
jgi:hypothetical protein